jgi:hypothetical protein
MSELEPGQAASVQAPPSPVRRWTGGDQVIGAALVVLIVSLFLPWYSSTTSVSAVAVTAESDGPRVHSYLWVVLVLAVIGLAVLVGRDAMVRLAANLPSPGQALVLVSVLAAALTVLAVASKPAGGTVHPVVAGLGQQFTEKISYDLSFGGLVAIAAALTALVAAFITSGPLQEASRAANAVGPATS